MKTETALHLCESLVCLQLEYCVLFWSLHPKNDVGQLERIQRKEGWSEVWNSFHMRKDCLDKDFRLEKR